MDLSKIKAPPGLRRIAGEGAGAVSETAKTETIVEHFGPMKPRNLEEELTNAFRSGTYMKRVLQEDMKVFRVYGEGTEKVGRWFTPTMPKGPLQAQLDLALNPKWGNTAQHIAEVTIPKGTAIYEGIAAEQMIKTQTGEIMGSLQGGVPQIFIEEVDPKWFN